MTKVIAKAIRLTRPVRGPAEPWLLGAFLVLFGIAVTASLSPIAVSIRTALGDAAGAPAGAQAERATIRVRIHVVRAALAQAASGHDLLPASVVSAPVSFDVAQVQPRAIDLSARIAERGFTARAPPQASA